MHILYFASYSSSVKHPWYSPGANTKISQTIQSLKKQISSTQDDLKFITEQLEIQKKLEESKQSLFELALVSETQVLAERNKTLE